MADDAGGKEVGRISIRVVPNLKKFWSDLKEAVVEAERSLHPEIKVGADMSKFRDEVRAGTKVLPDAKVKVKADLDQSSFLSTLAETKAAAKAAGVKLDVDFLDHGAEAKLAGLIAKLKAEAKLANIKLDVDVDKKHGFLGNIFGRGGGGGGGRGGLDVLPNIGGLGGIPSLILIGSLISLVVPALSLLSQALIGLPALITAVALPLGVFALGMGGIKDALEATGFLSTTKGKGGKEKIGIGDLLKQIQDPISEVFRTGLVPVFQELGGALPAITANLPKVAQGITDVIGGLVRGFTSGPGIQSLQNISTSVGQMLTNMGPGLQVFTQSLLKLVEVTSSHLPGLGNAIGEWSSKFFGWITKMSDPALGVNGKSLIDGAISNIKPVLDTLFADIGRLFDAGLKLANNPEQIQNIKDTLNGLTDIIIGALPPLESLFNVIAKFVKLLGKLGLVDLPTMSGDMPNKNKDGSFTDPGKSLTGGGIINPSDVAGSLGRIKEMMSTSFGVMWTEFTARASVAWSGLVTIATGAWTLISTTAQSIFATIWATISSAASTAWNAIASTASGVWNTITATVSTVASSIVGFFQGIPSQLGAIWNSAVSTINQAWDSVVSFAGTIPGKIVAALGDLGGLLVAAGRAAMDGLLNGIKAGAQAVYDFVSGIAGKIAALKGPLPYDRTVLVPNGQALMTGLQAGLEGGFEGVLGRAKQMAQQIADAIAQGTNPAGAAAGIKQTMAEIRAEYNQLKLQKDQTTDKGQKKALSDQMKQLTTVKDQLKVQSDQLGITNKMSDGQNDITKQFNEQLTKMVSAGPNFAMANVKQFESDLGISGNGAIPSLVDQGLGWATQALGKLISGGLGGGTTIHVNSIDEGLAAKRNIDNRKALQWDR